MLGYPESACQNVLLFLSGQAELVLDGRVGLILITAVQAKVLVHQAGRQAGHLLSSGHLQDWHSSAFSELGETQSRGLPPPGRVGWGLAGEDVRFALTPGVLVEYQNNPPDSNFHL